MATREFLVLDELDETQRAMVDHEIEAIEHRIHREALTEQAKRRLSDASGATHYLEVDDGSLTSYAQTIVVAGVIVVEFLGDAVNDALLDLVLDARGATTSLDLWVHGVHARYEPSASIPAEKVRTILRLQRPLQGAPELTNNEVQIRSFVQGDDEEAWLAVNAAAFVDHPEQGSIDRVELDRRMQLDWFDPTGFFLAEKEGSLRGFCWTKIHRQSWGDVGEIYAIGVHPDAAGQGLASLLLSRAFSWLSQEGLSTVMLYCEQDNLGARALYDKLGFIEKWQDQLWRVTK
jgi:mycothiol synthase